METNLGVNRKANSYITSFLGSVAIIILINRLAAIFSANESNWPIPLGILLLALMAAGIPVLFQRSGWAFPGLILTGIPFGIFFGRSMG
jgi:hypothetical protein